MNKDQFKDRTKPGKVRHSEISGKLFRDKLLENKGRSHRIQGRARAGYGDFTDDTQGYNDIEGDIRGYGDFRDDLEKSG